MLASQKFKKMTQAIENRLETLFSASTMLYMMSVHVLMPVRMMTCMSEAATLSKLVVPLFGFSPSCDVREWLSAKNCE